MDADRIDDHRQSGRHELQYLQTALAQAPRMVWMPGDADVGSGDFASLAVARPASRHNAHSRQLGKYVANHLELEPRQPTRGVLQPWQGIVERMQRAAAAHPDHLGLAAAAPVLGQRITIMVDTSGNDVDLRRSATVGQRGLS